MKYCGAKTRAGGTCEHEPGWGTDHLGVGKCKKHGGASPTKHGRYSRYSSKRLAERIAHHEADPDPLNLLPEVVLLRALVGDFVERYEEYRDALLAWNSAEYGEAAEEERKPRPQRILELDAASTLLEAVSRVVEKITKQQSLKSFTAEEVAALAHDLLKIVVKHSTPQAAGKIQKEWGVILEPDD